MCASFVCHFVYGDGDPHIEEAIPFMRGFPPSQRMSIGHHVDVAQAVSRLLEARSPSHRIYNVVDDEAPELAALFAAVGQPPPDGTSAERASAFNALLDGRRIREDLKFKPTFPRLADAIQADPQFQLQLEVVHIEILIRIRVHARDTSSCSPRRKYRLSCNVCISNAVCEIVVSAAGCDLVAVPIELHREKPRRRVGRRRPRVHLV